MFEYKNNNFLKRKIKWTKKCDPNVQIKLPFWNFKVELCPEPSSFVCGKAAHFKLYSNSPRIIPFAKV